MNINKSVSVDCVVFGFDGSDLKVLLIPQGDCANQGELKLPGSMIYQSEDLPDAASRVLNESTGLKSVYLKQLQVFSDPERVCGENLAWVNKRYGIDTERVITVAFYSLVRINHRVVGLTSQYDACWKSVNSIKTLALDHKHILLKALEVLSDDIVHTPVAFELLPRRFTLRQLQNLYEAVVGLEIDNRNFRKKILTSGYLTPTDKREVGVAHKPALYYTFNKVKYEREQRNRFKLSFI